MRCLRADHVPARASDVTEPTLLDGPPRIDIFTLFPAMFSGPFSESIIKRACARGQLDIRLHNIRDWASDKHHMADDTPYGGGAGMVMKAPPIVEAVEAVLGTDLESARIAIMSAGGRRFTQAVAREMSVCSRLALICGHYEGIDERVSEILHADELSLGDFVLTGGEIAAMAITDAIARLVPGVIDAQSIADESHGPDTSTVEHPHYTRPASYRGLEVPAILRSGDHGRISSWRAEQSRARTERWRPDLLDGDAT